MNLLLLFENDFLSEDMVRIFDRRFNHLVSVNQIKEGDSLQCGLVNGKMGDGRILKITRDFIDIQVNLFHLPPDPLPLILVMALPRPKMLKRVIECVSSLGVKQVYLINSWRVEKSYWQSPLLQDENLLQYLILGLEQSKDTVLPVIHQKRFFTDFVKNELKTISKNTLCITAHPKGTYRISHNVSTPVTLVIGPEGGFIDIEIETLENIGFCCVSAGPRIMRVETAVPYLIAALFS